MDQLPRLGKRELICLLLFTCNYVVSVWRGFLFLWVLGMGYVILLWHSLSLPYSYIGIGNDLEQFLRVEIELAFAVPPRVHAWCSTQCFLKLFYRLVCDIISCQKPYRTILNLFLFVLTFIGIIKYRYD